MSKANNIFSIGLDDRDRLNKELGGGIPTGSIVLMEGDYGAGKSAISQRFATGSVRPASPSPSSRPNSRLRDLSIRWTR